jgi:regulator of protease activity HflC (stomatin/prohibitin superfamily)
LGRLSTNSGQGNVSNFAQTRPTRVPILGCNGLILRLRGAAAGDTGSRGLYTFDCRRAKPFRQPDGSMMDSTFIFGILVIVALLYLVGALRVLRQYERGVVFILGKFEGVRGPGLTLIFVPVQQMVRVSLRTVTMQIPSQKIITKDNVSIDIAAVAYYHISDPEKAVIVIENVYNAINQISQTTVRNVVGRFSLDQLLSDTASINLQIKNVIDGHTEPWGTQVTAVEIKDIVLPDNMQRAMAKEAEAERERRAKIVAAEGEYQAAVKLGQAADIITAHPVALQLRTLQTMAEISVEKNSTIIFPAQFMTTVQEAFGLMSKDSASK